MAHTSDYSEIYVKASGTDRGLSMYEIAACLGEDSGDLGTLCKSNKIKIMAKYKPERRNIHGHLTDTMRATGTKYGIECPGYASAASLRQASGMYYLRPNSIYRQLDFASFNGDPATTQGRGYYNRAPAVPAVCVNKGTVAGNVIDENESTKIAFYAAMNDGYYKWKTISDTMGFGSASLIPSGTTEAYFSARCLAIEDILLTDLTNNDAYFGVALFQSTQLKYFVKCEHPISHSNVADNQNHIIPLVGQGGLIQDYDGNGGGTYVVDGAELAQGGGSSGGSQSQTSTSVAYGTYNAVPAIYYNNNYYRLYADSTYSNSFTLKLGGEEMYEASNLGGCFTQTGTYANSLSDSHNNQHNQLWVKVRFSDVGYGKPTKIAAAHLGRLKIKGTLNGTVDGSTLDRNIIEEAVFGTVQDITISANGYIDLYFTINGIYEPASSSGNPQTHNTARRTLEYNLYYENLQIPTDGGLFQIDVTLS